MNSIPDIRTWPVWATHVLENKHNRNRYDFACKAGDKFYMNETTDDHYLMEHWLIAASRKNLDSQEETSEKQDNVHSPSHYMIIDGVEFKDVRRALLNTCDEQGTPAWQVDCWSRSFEYIGRMWGKNGLEDAKKARVYLDWLIEAMESEK